MTTTNWTKAAAAALALAITGCDPTDDEAGADAVALRDGDGTWGPGKLNTNFLGKDETLPLDAIPLQDDPNADIRLHAVWTKKCIDTRTGKPAPNGLYYTSDLNGELGITLDGEGAINPATFRLYGNDAVTCKVAGADWVGTVWGIIYKGKNYYMMILDRQLDDTGRLAWKWGVFAGGDLFIPTSYAPTCAEDKDPFGNAVVYKHHAYLFDGLDVDPDTGDFLSVDATMYIACFSGIVGKSARWGYGTWDVGAEAHELASRMGRADYCGDGTPYTVQGNRLQIRDTYGINDFEAVTYSDEAAWSLEAGRATCVTMPRHKPLRENFSGIACAGGNGSFILPACSAQHMAAPTFATKIAD